MGDNKYEGWSNHPTWCVNLWLANDEGLYLEALGVVRTAIASVDVLVAPEPRSTVADALKDWVEEVAFPADRDGRTHPDGMVGDLTVWAFNQVNWRELAESWIGTCDELRQAGASK
jgi:hypothetical protein